MIDASEHLGLVWKVIHKYKYRPPAGMDMDDLFQIGCIGLVRAAKRYKPELGYKFSSLATMAIRREIIRSKIKDARLKRQGENVSLYLELNEDGATFLDILPDKTSIEWEVIKEETTRRLLTKEPVIAGMLIMGYKRREIAKHLGLTEQRISQKVMKLRGEVV